MTMNREPLAISGAVVTALQGVLTAVILMGWWDLTAEQAAAWMGAIDLAGTAAVVIYTRGKVTPVADPRDNNGASLVPYTDQWKDAA